MEDNVFDIDRNITYSTLNSWQNHFVSSLTPWTGSSIVISLPVGVEAFAAYLAAKELVVAYVMAPQDQDKVLETMSYWNCSAALVSFEPSADLNSLQLLPGIWLISNKIPTLGTQEPGICLLTSGTTGAAKSIKIPRSQFDAHWNMALDNGYNAGQDETWFLGLPLWTSMGFTTAWIVYQARAKSIFKLFKATRGQIVSAFDQCNVLACGIGLLRVSRIQPVNGKRIIVTGPGLTHENKLKLADQLRTPVLYQYGATEVTTISQQTLDNWHLPGNGIPLTEHRITKAGTMEVWCRREDCWWDTQDLVKVENDGQISVTGRAIFGSIRTLAGTVNLNSVKSDLLQKGLVDEAEFILVPNNNEYCVGFVYRGNQDKKNIQNLLKTYNHDVNFVDWTIQEDQIRRNEIGKIDRAYYLSLQN